jgi:hypothetical protein
MEMQPEANVVLEHHSQVKHKTGNATDQRVNVGQCCLNANKDER